MYSVINFKKNGDARGSLVVIESGAQIPFDIRRVFYIYDTVDDVVRGNHANRNSQFVLVCLHGSCKVKIRLPRKETVVALENPHTGLWLDRMVWKEMYDFSEGAVLLVLSSETYDQNEYIKDFDTYLREMGG